MAFHRQLPLPDFAYHFPFHIEIVPGNRTAQDLPCILQRLLVWAMWPIFSRNQRLALSFSKLWQYSQLSIIRPSWCLSLGTTFYITGSFWPLIIRGWQTQVHNLNKTESVSQYHANNWKLTNIDNQPMRGIIKMVCRDPKCRPRCVCTCLQVN